MCIRDSPKAMWYMSRFTNYMPDEKGNWYIAKCPTFEEGQKCSVVSVEQVQLLHSSLRQKSLQQNSFAGLKCLRLVSRISAVSYTHLKEHDDVYVLDADLAAATQTAIFKKEFPNRHIDCGIADSYTHLDVYKRQSQYHMMSLEPSQLFDTMAQPVI